MVWCNVTEKNVRRTLEKSGLKEIHIKWWRNGRLSSRQSVKQGTEVGIRAWKLSSAPSEILWH